MTTSTLSPKNQTTLSVEFVRKLNLPPGTKFKQTMEGGKIILHPLPGVASAFGALKTRRKFISIEAETKGMEKALSRRIAAKRKR